MFKVTIVFLTRGIIKKPCCDSRCYWGDGKCHVSLKWYYTKSKERTIFHVWGCQEYILKWCELFPSYSQRVSGQSGWAALYWAQIECYVNAQEASNQLLSIYYLRSKGGFYFDRARSLFSWIGPGGPDFVSYGGPGVSYFKRIQRARFCYTRSERRGSGFIVWGTGGPNFVSPPFSFSRKEGTNRQLLNTDYILRAKMNMYSVVHK